MPCLLCFFWCILPLNNQQQNNQYSKSDGSLLEIKELQTLLAPYLLLCHSPRAPLYSKFSPFLPPSLKWNCNWRIFCIFRWMFAITLRCLGPKLSEKLTNDSSINVNSFFARLSISLGQAIFHWAPILEQNGV